MNAIPATLAGVTRLVMVTPPTKDGSVNPYVLFAAGICGIKEIYKVGGAQAIGALAFGTETIPKVDKITGPGNIYVAVAKRLVDVEIDMVAGPSEVLILADRSANPAFIAADLLSQAEHDPLASAILITTSPTLAREVEEEIKLQTERLQRKTVIASALKEYSAIIVVKNLEDGIELANRIAPEHLEVMTENPFEILPWIRNAGAVFLGEHSPVPIGDYIAGPNHILPTGGAAKFSSPLGVDDFLKRTNFIAYTEAGLKEVGAKVERLAEIEGFEAHAGSIRIRIRGGINDE
jgi:histidinol dehydrogenase